MLFLTVWYLYSLPNITVVKCTGISSNVSDSKIALLVRKAGALGMLKLKNWIPLGEQPCKKSEQLPPKQELVNWFIRNENRQLCLKLEQRMQNSLQKTACIFPFLSCVLQFMFFRFPLGRFSIDISRNNVSASDIDRLNV